MRSSARKRMHNRGVKSRLHSLERKYLALVTAGKKDDAVEALRVITSAFDKAARSGVVHRATADRKKSRLSTRLRLIK